MPRDISVVRPRSYCPSCEHPIAWYDNIPLLSFLLLRARCRHCGAPIPLRYPIVELLTGGVFFLSVLMLGVTLAALKICLFGALVIALIFSDLEERILPDEFTLGGAAAGLILAWFVPIDDFTGRMLTAVAGWQPNAHWASVAEAAAGAVIPSSILWLGGWAFEKIRHKEGLGFGDVKMLGMIGAFLGVRGSLLALVAGSLLGSVVGLLYILVTRKDASTYELPFGTFLGIAAIAVAALGPVLGAGTPSGWH
jgi:leader peptidase (prepilin peptidase)/N-methyltransferase